MTVEANYRGKNKCAGWCKYLSVSTLLTTKTTNLENYSITHFSNYGKP